MNIPEKFDGKKFSEKYNLDTLNGDFWIDQSGLVCPSLPDLTDADIADCVVTPTYNIAPTTNVVIINSDVLITINAEPNTTITLYAYPIDVAPSVDHELSDCVIDAGGLGAVTFTPIEIGEYAVRGKTGELASKIVLIKAVG